MTEGLKRKVSSFLNMGSVSQFERNVDEQFRSATQSSSALEQRVSELESKVADLLSRVEALESP